MIAVISAGGKGTRVASVNRALPKPMLPVCGKPVLQLGHTICNKESKKYNKILSVGCNQRWIKVRKRTNI